MSDDQPTTPPPGEPEYLGHDSPAPLADEPAGGRRWGLVAGAGIAVVAAVAGGGFALAQLMAASGSPADAVPANALAYASIDLDPSAAQKISAITTLRKFPELKKELDLDAQDDVRRWLFEDVLGESACKDLDYDDDIAPWLGDRMAVAAVPDVGQKVSPLFAVQVSDEAAAAAGIAALGRCSEEEIGVAFTGGYAVLMERQNAAETFARAAEAAALGRRPRLPDLGGAARRARHRHRLRLRGGTRPDDRPGDRDGRAAATLEMLGQDVGRLYRRLRGCRRGAPLLRTAGSSSRLAAAGLPEGVGTTADPGAPALGDLPATTAAAFTVSFADGWFEDWSESMGDLLAGAAAGGGSEDLWRDIEAETGLQLPEDIEALLGDGLRVSVDASLSADTFTSSDVPQADLGLRINGDEAEINRVLDTLIGQVPPSEASDALKRSTGDGYVVIGLDQDYVDSLGRGR